jgi:stress response protein YsnF
VRAEHIDVEKHVIVYERVRVMRHDLGGVSRREADVRREVLRVDPLVPETRD